MRRFLVAVVVVSGVAVLAGCGTAATEMSRDERAQKASEAMYQAYVDATGATAVAGVLRDEGVYDQTAEAMLTICDDGEAWDAATYAAERGLDNADLIASLQAGWFVACPD